MGFEQTIALMSVPLGFILVFSPLWRWVRMFETIIHEFGHAFIGVFLGQKLKGFKIRYDTSGETNTLTYGYGVRGVLTHVAGYPAPIILGAVTIYYTLMFNAASVFIYLYMFISVVMLVFIRNWFGIIPVLIMFTLASLSFIIQSNTYDMFIVLTLGVTLTVGGLRSVAHLWRKPEGSDAFLIKTYLGGPVYFWVTVITLFSFIMPILLIMLVNWLMSVTG